MHFALEGFGEVEGITKSESEGYFLDFQVGKLKIGAGTQNFQVSVVGHGRY